MTLLTVADANHFRVKVGRFGDRWYTDPLTGCTVAPAIQPDEAWPSFSTIKKAAGADWSYVAMKRAAYAPEEELARLLTLDPAQRYDTLKSINSHGLNVAAGRGTILHWWGEDMLHGRKPRKVTPEMLAAHRIPAESLERAKRYGPALRDFFDTYQPEVVATEYVAIHRTLNGVGYGCTPDGLMRVEGGTYAYDFKSRSEDGDHAAYPEEGAQIAAGVSAEYMIADGGRTGIRQHLPAVDGGLVISIKPEGVRLYPVDIGTGFEHFERMHAWWIARRSERDSIGRPWPVKTKGPACSSSSTPTADPSPSTPPPASSPETHEPSLSPSSSTPSPTKTSKSSPSATETSSDSDGDSAGETPQGGDSYDPSRRGDVVAVLGYNHDEGEPVDADRFAELEQRYRACSEQARAWFARISSDANDASVRINARTTKTRRRHDIYDGLITLGEADAQADEVARACAAEAVGSDAPLYPCVTTGHAIGAMDAKAAAKFAVFCDAYVFGDFTATFRDDGLMRLEST